MFLSIFYFHFSFFIWLNVSHKFITLSFVSRFEETTYTTHERVKKWINKDNLYPQHDALFHIYFGFAISVFVADANQYCDASQL